MFKKVSQCILLALFIIAAGVCIFTVPVSAAADVEFYVSPAGNDSNAGTIESPFLTIERARQEVQKHTSDMTGDIYVYIRGGSYFVDKTITFTEKDSGTNGHTVYYKNYADEKPVIYGGKRIDNWEPWQNGIYKAALTEDMNFYAMTEDLEWSCEACYPNDGYLNVAKEGKSNRKNTVLYFNDGDIPENLNLDYLRVKNFPYLNYASATWPVIKIDRDNNSVLMNSSGEVYSNVSTTIEGRYRLIGDISFLDAPGEFYLDRNEKILYYYPRSNNIYETEIVAPMVKCLFMFGGSNAEETVKNISVDGLTLSTTDFAESFHQGDLAGDVVGADAMVKLENAENITVSNCRILNAGIDAVWLEGFACNNTISGNFIKNTGYIGILMSGYAVREAMGRYNGLVEAYCNKSNTITNNCIRSVGINAAHGAGIQLFQSGDNIITHNEISDSPRYGISVKGEDKPDAICCWGINIPASGNIHSDKKSMLYDLRFAQNNYIAYNDLYDCMKETSDGGVFETYSAGRGNVFENNLIHDTAALYANGKFYGIYLDAGSVNWRIENNIMYNLSACEGGKSILINPGIYNQVQNNFIDEFNGNVNGVIITGSSSVFNKNILYSSENTLVVGSGLNNLFSMENNLYYSAKGKYRIVSGGGDGTFSSWQSQGTYDQNSVVGVLPRFKDAENHDYTLLADSPAITLGIENAAGAAGLTADYKWKKENYQLPNIIEREEEASDRIIDPTGSLRLECENAEYFNSVEPTESYMGGISSASYLGFYGVEMTNVKRITVRYAVPESYSGHKVEFRLDSRSGKILGSFVTKKTGGWHSFDTATFSIEKASGKHTIYMVFPDAYSGIGNFDWIRLETDTNIAPGKDLLSDSAGSGNQNLRDYGDIKVIVNGEFLYNCGAELLNDDVMLPLDETISCLGFSHNSASNTVTDKEGNRFTYTVGSKTILLNGGRTVQLSCNVMKNEKEKIYIPASVFQVAFGDCVMYSELSRYCRIFDVNSAELIANPDNDLAWRKTAIASSFQKDKAEVVLDGDSSTEWNSFYDNREWICVDLGSRLTFNTIQIDWGENYSRAFEIYVSNEFEVPEDVEPIYSYYTYEGGTWSRRFEPITARYVFVYLKCKGGVRASSIKDIHIYNYQ